MPRPYRLQIAGQMYHLTTRSSAKRPIFLDDEDRMEFLRLVRVTCGRYNIGCHWYVLMTTHYHLLATTWEENLARAMQLLNGEYGRWFNDRRDLHGHVWGARYESVLVESDAHLLWLQSYLAMNPVLAGLCRRPEDWPWSSYRRLIGLEPKWFLALPELLRLFAHDPKQARRRIESMVSAHVDPIDP